MRPFWSLIAALWILSPIASLSQTGVEDQKELAPEEMINPQVPQWVMKTNPLRVLWGPLPLTAEYRLNVETIQSRYQSSQVGFSYLGESPLISFLFNQANAQNSNGYMSYDLQIRGARLQFAHKFYLRGVFPWLDPGGTLSSYAPNGYYIAPYFSASYGEVRVNHAARPFLEMTHLNANLILGRQIFFWEVFAVDLYMGVGVKENIWRQREPQNHNASIINQGDMGAYGGDYRFMMGVDVGIHF